VDRPAIRKARTLQRRAAKSSWVDGLARYGLVAKGVSYGLVGVLAGTLAIGSGGKATSRGGALATLADETYGKVLLVLLALGFAAYGIWRLLQALFDREDEGSGAKGLVKRAGYLGRAAIYAGLTYTTIRLLTGSGGNQSQTREARKTTAQVLDWPAGRWLVGITGLCLIGAGLFNGYRAFTQKFEEKWKGVEMGRAERRWAARIGTAGLLSRLVVFSLIGVFLLKAALEYDPQEAIGLDGALQKVAQASYGPWLLGFVAAGLICYGIFCFVEARYRRV
jgi:uncharacterized membrane protein HdeD (DUF308 family)